MMSEKITPIRAQFWADVKCVFLKWEKLRLVYNPILAIILFVSLPGYGLPFFKSGFQNLAPVLFYWLISAVCANLLFFAAPAAEAYARWLGVKGQWITIALFVGGVLISIPLVVVFGAGAGAYMLGPGMN